MAKTFLVTHTKTAVITTMDEDYAKLIFRTQPLDDVSELLEVQDITEAEVEEESPEVEAIGDECDEGDNPFDEMQPSGIDPDVIAAADEAVTVRWGDLVAQLGVDVAVELIDYEGPEGN